jgi:hypothetical protein
MRTVLAVSFLAAAALAAETPPLRVPDAFTPVAARFVGADTAPVKGTDGRWHVVYELWLTNTRAQPATVERIEVLDYDHQDRVVGTLAGDALRAATRNLTLAPAADMTLAANASRLVFVELAFEDAQAVPDRIVHRLRGTGAGGPGSTKPEPIRYLLAPWDVAERPVPVIGPPLRGKGWVAINGCCSLAGAHRGAVLPIDGNLYAAQRFVIDWIQIGADGKTVTGDPTKVESWLGYDAPLLAVADGTVAQVLDGLEDQKPGALPDPATITIENVDGNHVILDIGGGVYAFYAHMKKGSVAVKKGQHVKRGHELGRLGNTGNTSGPHLHLHLMTAPSALGADGIPYVFDRFTLAGGLDPARWYDPDSPMDDVNEVLPGDGRGPRAAELPLDLQVVDFD